MSLDKYVNRLERIDQLIRFRSTGTPCEFAEKLGISERWLYEFITQMKDILGCPIKYSYTHRSYVYTKNGNIQIGFKFETLSGIEEDNLSGGFFYSLQNKIELSFSKKVSY